MQKDIKQALERLRDLLKKGNDDWMQELTQLRELSPCYYRKLVSGEASIEEILTSGANTSGSVAPDQEQ